VPPSLNQLPDNLIYTAGGTFYEMDRTRHTTDLMPSWMTAADMPALSPDGKTLVFMRWSTYASDLYSYNLRTRAVPTQITHDASPNPQQVWNYMWAAWPAFSPDGKTILFSGDRYKLASAANESRKLDLAIYAMNPDGSNLRQITTPATGAGGDTDAQFIGKSSRFLYDHWAYHMQSTPSGELAVGQPYSQLMIADLNNPNVSWALTPPSGQIVQPTVDRRGDRVAYVKADGGISQLIVARLVMTKSGPQLRRQKVLASGEVAQPALTPDGRWIAYLQADGDGFSIYVERSSGGPAVKLSEAGTGVDALSRPIWVP
jgi:Tol biopolymer transport system component